MPSTLGPLVGMVLQELNASLGQPPSRDVQMGSSRFLWNRKTESIFEIEICSKNLLSVLDKGSIVFVFIAEIIREDGQAYFGFLSPSERDLFLELKEIDSIGNKTAALALRELGVSGLKLLSSHGVNTVGKVAGLGPKTLERLKAGLQGQKVEFEKLFQVIAKNSSAMTIRETGNLPGIKNDSENLMGLSIEKSISAESSPATADLPTVVVQALLKLGIPGPDIFSLFESFQKEEPLSLGEISTSELVKKMLSRWSRVRQKRQVNVPEKGI